MKMQAVTAGASFVAQGSALLQLFDELLTALEVGILGLDLTQRKFLELLRGLLLTKPQIETQHISHEGRSAGSLKYKAWGSS